MSHLALYFIFVLENFQILLYILYPLIGIPAVILLIHCGVQWEWEDPAPKAIPYLKCAAIILTISSLMTIFIPTTSEIAVIYAVPKILNNKDVRQIPPKLIKLANVWLTKQLQNEIQKIGENPPIGAKP